MPAMRGGPTIWLTLWLVAPLLAGCAQSKMVYLSADGRPVAGDPALSRDFDAARAACNDLMARSVQAGDHGDGGLTRGNQIGQAGDECMAEYGYVAVRQDEAAARQRQLAAEAAAAAAARPGN